MRFPFFPRLLTALAVLTVCVAPLPLAAQQPPAKAANLFGEFSGFEKSSLQDNLWDGVNSDGTLAVFTYSADVVTERAAFGKLAMPPSVAFIDLNGDGKPDLIAADPTGFFHFYPNSGAPGAPKFTSAELIPLFLSPSHTPRKLDYEYNGGNDATRFCPRFALADWRRTGLLDLLVGNYFGEILFLPNTGNARQPIYRWQGDVEKLRVQTNDQGRFWANLLSPVACDWNGNGRLDLLAGEGTYSANAIHLLENVGSSDTPKFSSAPGKHTYLAYGDGREQLIPAAVDYNGDGKLDLLVADRTGEVGLYLNTSKPGEELKRTSTISFGSTTRLPGLCSLYAADYNGDGLFDLLIGQPNGHIAVALNTGTKTEPKFGPPQDIKGEDRLKRDTHSPDGWTSNPWNINGNALTCVNVVTNQTEAKVDPPEGAACLKLGYWPTAQQTFPWPAEGIPDTPRHITAVFKGITLNVGKHYRFSFKAKGNAVEKVRWDFRGWYHGIPATAKVERDERGVAKHGGIIEDEQRFEKDINVGGSWAPVQGDFIARWKSPALAGETTMKVTFYLDFWATSPAGALYVDDFQLIEAQ